MSISVKPEDEAYLKRLVAEGAYASVEEAAAAAIAALRTRDDDLSWAKPFIEPALASLDRGEGSSHEEAFGRVREHIEAARRRRP